MRIQLLVLIVLFLFVGSSPAPRFAPALDEVTEAQLVRVHEAFVEARKCGFSVESMVAIYKLDNAAAAVKKLVDAEQSNPARCIRQGESFAMEATRDRMNQSVLDRLAEVTGGTVEVLNFGKQNGIRSDKDQTIYAVDGKRFYTAAEMRAAFGDTFESLFGIDMAKMDMAMFDGDAAIPDWRRVDIDLETHKTKFEKGQAKLEQNPETYREAGTFRAEVDGRASSQGRVRITRFDPETGKTEVLHGDASDFSSRYHDWTADVPYRNAMDVAVENKGKFAHANDFIDRMKYFNRTVGNGMNALALDDWDKPYIFHLAQMETAAERRDFIKRMVDDTYLIDASPAERDQFVKVIELSAQIEIDKMKGATRSEDEYLRPIMEVERKNARSRGEDIGDDELLIRARTNYHSMQSQVMDRNIVITTRQKILKDFDPGHLKKIAGKYGIEQAKKLRWETGRQIGRAFEKIDPELAKRLVADAPEALRPELESLRQVAELRRAAKPKVDKGAIRLRTSDERSARTRGPEEVILAQEADSFIENRKREANDLMAKLRARYDDFDSEVRSGRWTDAEVSKLMRDRVLDELGFEQRQSFEEMESAYTREFSGSKLLSNVVTLGNVSSLLSCIQVYQQTGDLTQVAQTALWEMACNIPGVSQIATLKQSFNDGSYQGLTWIFIAWQLPAAGQVKLVIDVAANTMRVIYDHAMTPLASDRFSQVYLGYVAKQPAGWSPLVPGWKEQREAVGDSILKHVPGETFAEKRTNIYPFFQKKIDEKLRRAGLDPRGSEYWEKRERILDSYFGSYVSDYVNAKGDFGDNLTAGLYGMAGQKELERKLISTLKKDFLQSEINVRKMEAELDDYLEKMKDLDRIAAESIAVEKQLLGSGEFLAGKLQDQQQKAFAAIPADSETKEMKPRVEIEAYPRFVLEGQEASITVKAISAENEVGGQKHKITIKRRQAEALVRGEHNAGAKLERLTGESDAALVKKLTDELSPDCELFVSKLLYDVIVESPDGKLIESQTVELNLAAAERQVAPSSATRVMVRVTRRVDKDRRGLWVNSWEEPSADNCAGGLRNVNTLDQRFSPSVWTRWPDMPAAASYGARIKARGGVPSYENEIYLRISPERDFDHVDGSAVPGNGFVVSIPMPSERTAGEIEVSGELLAFVEERPTGDLKDARTLARHPFSASFRFFVPPYCGDAIAKVGDEGFVVGKLRLRDRQAGDRIVEVGSGSSCYFVMFNDTAGFRLPATETLPSEIHVRFMDYGQMADYTLTIQPDTPRREYKPATSRLPEYLEKLTQLKANNEDDRNADGIARLYGDCAGSAHAGGRSCAEFEDYKKYKLEEIAWRRRLLKRAEDRNWSGWRLASMGYKRMYLDTATTETDRRLIYDAKLSEIRHGLAAAHMSLGLVSCRRYLADEAKPHFEAAKTLIAAITIDAKLIATAYKTLANFATQTDGYADAVFHTTGDLEAARAIHDEGNGYFKKAEEAEGKPISPRRPYRFAEDDQFRNPNAGSSPGSGSGL